MNEHHVNEVMNSEELAVMLNAKQRHINDLSNAGDIPATKVGKNWIYLRGVILKWLEEKMLKEQAEIKEKKLGRIKSKTGYQPSTVIPSAAKKMERINERKRG